jgi:DNA-binding NtrC family response regulator
MAVTSVDLAQRAERDQFDRELYRRLAATQLQVPPLRERQDDIPQLAERFLERFGARLGSPRFSDDVLWVLQSYDWPGNVRELELTVERACRNLESEEVLIEHLPRALRDLFDSLSSRDELPVVHRRTDRPQGTHGVAAAQTRRPQTTYGMQALNEGDQNISLEAFEKQALLRALDQTGGDKLAAARLLKIGKSTLYRKLKRYDIK